MRFKCDKKSDCKFCAECCKFREKSIVEPEEELKIKKNLFSKTGTLYLYPFSRYTINITPKEKEVLEKAAKEAKIELSILPKKVFIVEEGIVVYDYFLDHDECPFLNSSNKCSIYSIRPQICKDFPNESYDNADFVNFQKNNLIIKEGYEKCLEYVRSHLL